jgi:hypothetical protein
MILRNKNPMIVLGSGQLFLGLGISGVFLLSHLDLGRTGAFLTGFSSSFALVSVLLTVVALIRISRQSAV